MDIPTLVRSCLAEFDSLRKAGPTDNESSQYRLDNELSRFKIWAGNLAAHRESGRRSLEYRLRDSENLRNKVLDLLSTVLEVLKSGHVTENLDVPQSSNSDSDSLDFEYDDLATQPVDHLRDLHQAISLLYHFSVALRAPAGHSRIEHGISSYSKFFYPKDVEHVTYKFPEAEMFLAERLGKGISARRQYFNYRQTHDEKMNAGLDEPEEEGIPSTIASSYRPRKVEYTALDDDTGSISSMNSFAPTESETGRLRPPPLPEEGSHGEPFKCPICFSPQCVQGEYSWQKHVFEDVVPYLCTEQDCAVPNKLYARRKDWQRHQSKAHYSVWICPLGCDTTHHSSDRLEGHLVKMHNYTTDAAVLRRISDGAAKPSGQTQDLRCPLCQKLNATVRLWYRHVGKHMEQLALYALPGHLFGEDSGDEESIAEISAPPSARSSESDVIIEPSDLPRRESALSDDQPERVGFAVPRFEFGKADILQPFEGTYYSVQSVEAGELEAPRAKIPDRPEDSRDDHSESERRLSKNHQSHRLDATVVTEADECREIPFEGYERILRDTEYQSPQVMDTTEWTADWAVDTIPESQGNRATGSGDQEMQESARPFAESARPRLTIAIPKPEEEGVRTDADDGVNIIRLPSAKQRRSFDDDDNFCSLCNASFSTQADLRHHLRSHAPDINKHVCLHCEKRFRYRKDLARHLPRHDPDRKKYYCRDLNCKYHAKGFGREDHLDRHMKSKHPDLLRDESRKEDGDPQSTIREEEDRSHLPEPYV